MLAIKFHDKNNYGKPAGADKNPDDEVINACWVANCAMSAIEKAYAKNAPRRVEMEKLYKNMLYQIKNQITPEQYRRLSKYFKPIEEPQPTSIEK